MAKAETNITTGSGPLPDFAPADTSLALWVLPGRVRLHLASGSWVELPWIDAMQLACRVLECSTKAAEVAGADRRTTILGAFDGVTDTLLRAARGAAS